MSEPNEVITLGPVEEADRLWRHACSEFDQSERSLTSLCESLELGLRATEIIVVEKLGPVKDRLPATIGLLLESPGPEIDVYRDAVIVPRTLRFTEALDLLSAESLDCVGPRLHRGWEDRKFSCRRSRQTAQEAIGVTLEDEMRQQLLKLSAYRNRVFHTPPPVRLDPGEMRGAFPALVDFVDKLRA